MCLNWHTSSEVGSILYQNHHEAWKCRSGHPWCMPPPQLPHPPCDTQGFMREVEERGLALQQASTGLKATNNRKTEMIFCFNCWKIADLQSYELCRSALFEKSWKCDSNLEYILLQSCFNSNLCFWREEVPETTYRQMWVGGQKHVIFWVIDVKYWAPTDMEI